MLPDFLPSALGGGFFLIKNRLAKSRKYSTVHYQTGGVQSVTSPVRRVAGTSMSR